MVRAWRLALLFLLISVPAIGQTTCPAPGFVGRGVEAQMIGTPPALHWVLPAVPNDSDLSIGDDASRQALNSAFMKVQAQNIPIVLDPRAPGGLSLEFRMQQHLGAGVMFSIVAPAELKEKPKATRGPAGCLREDQLSATDRHGNCGSIHPGKDGSVGSGFNGRSESGDSEPSRSGLVRGFCRNSNYRIRVRGSGTTDSSAS